MKKFFATAQTFSIKAALAVHTAYDMLALPASFAIGTGLLLAGLSEVSLAQTPMLAAESQIVVGICRVLLLPAGAFGGLVMAVAGVVALVSAAMGQYKAAMSLLVVGCGAWLIKPILQLFIGTPSCGEGQAGMTFVLPRGIE